MLLRILLLLACGLAASQASALEWSETEVQLLYSGHYSEPANPNDVAKSIVTLQHADGYSLGRNFMFVDILQSNSQELDLAGNRESPTEVYGEAYTTLSLSKLSGKSYGFGPVKDLGLTAGINLGDKSSQLHPKARVFLAGVTFDFDVPKGFFNVDVLGYWDHSCFGGIQSCPDYHSTYQVTPSWFAPFSVGGLDFEFTGFADFIGSRGAGTVRQVLSQPQLRLDVGKLFSHKGHLYAGFEYQYWHNKFGNDGVNESHPQLLVLWKF